MRLEARGLVTVPAPPSRLTASRKRGAGISSAGESNTRELRDLLLRPREVTSALAYAEAVKFRCVGVAFSVHGIVLPPEVPAERARLPGCFKLSEESGQFSDRFWIVNVLLPEPIESLGSFADRGCVVGGHGSAHLL